MSRGAGWKANCDVLLNVADSWRNCNIFLFLFDIIHDNCRFSLIFRLWRYIYQYMNTPWQWETQCSPIFCSSTCVWSCRRSFLSQRTEQTGFWNLCRRHYPSVDKERRTGGVGKYSFYFNYWVTGSIDLRLPQSHQEVLPMELHCCSKWRTA